MIRLITFDVTNTIIRFRQPPGQQYAMVAHQYGLDLNPDVVNKTFKESFKKHNKLSPNFGVHSAGYEHWWCCVVKDTFNLAGANASDPTLNSIAHHLIKHFSSKEAYTLVDGTLNILNKIVEKDIKLGVISNSDNRLWEILSQLEISQYFNFIINSYKSKILKPDPEIFNLALKKYDFNIKPKEALHIGDNLELDYLGSKSAGWNSILISPNYHNQCHKVGIDSCSSSMFSSLNEVISVIESMP